MTTRATLMIGALASALLSGCAASDDASGRFLVQPDRFQLYSCRQLAEAAQSFVERLQQLEEVMTKAGSDATGRAVSNMAYRPEYLQLRGMMNEIRRTAAEKKCKFDVDAVAGARVSDQAIRWNPPRMWHYKGAGMGLLISILITFLVVILVLYLVNMLPIDGRAKQIVRVIVIIIGVLSLLKYLAIF
jgi:hypothetical protein